MFQLILLAAVIYILVQWLQRSSPPAGKTRAAGPSPAVGAIEEMVQDPVCGIWIPVTQALVQELGGESLHFCSSECREKFRREQGTQ